MQKAINAVPETEFIVHSGDIVDNGIIESQWSNILNYSKDILINLTIAPVAGNHERQENAFIEHFNINFPDNCNTSTGAYYSYDYSNTHFINLNTNENSQEYLGFTPTQVEWLKSDIEQAKNKGSKWIILNMHKGPYTLGPHVFDDDIINKKGIRNILPNIVEPLDVDIVLQGHDHFLSYTKPLYNGIVNTTGTIYFNSGTAGPKVYNLNKKLKLNYLKLFDYIPNVIYKRGETQNFSAITINNTQLRIDIYEINQKINNKQPILLNTFIINKN